MTISSIQQIIENLSEEELNTEILLSTYFPRDLNRNHRKRRFNQTMLTKT